MGLKGWHPVRWMYAELTNPRQRVSKKICTQCPARPPARKTHAHCLLCPGTVSEFSGFGSVVCSASVFEIEAAKTRTTRLSSLRGQRNLSTPLLCSCLQSKLHVSSSEEFMFPILQTSNLFSSEAFELLSSTAFTI